MPQPMRPSQLPGGTAFPTTSQKYKTGEAIVIGSILKQDGNGELVLATSAADAATGVVGVADERAASKPGNEPGFASTVIASTAVKQEVSYARADGNTNFSAEGDRAPLESDVGVSYDVAVNGGIWTINTAATANVAAKIVGVDLINNWFYFTFVGIA